MGRFGCVVENKRIQKAVVPSSSSSERILHLTAKPKKIHNRELAQKSGVTQKPMELQKREPVSGMAKENKASRLRQLSMARRIGKNQNEHEQGIPRNSNSENLSHITRRSDRGPGSKSGRQARKDCDFQVDPTSLKSILNGTGITSMTTFRSLSLQPKRQSLGPPGGFFGPNTSSRPGISSLWKEGRSVTSTPGVVSEFGSGSSRKMHPDFLASSVPVSMSTGASAEKSLSLHGDCCLGKEWRKSPENVKRIAGSMTSAILEEELRVVEGVRLILSEELNRRTRKSLHFGNVEMSQNPHPRLSTLAEGDEREESFVVENDKTGLRESWKKLRRSAFVAFEKPDSEESSRCLPSTTKEESGSLLMGPKKEATPIGMDSIGSEDSTDRTLMGNSCVGLRQLNLRNRSITVGQNTGSALLQTPRPTKKGKLRKDTKESPTAFEDEETIVSHPPIPTPLFLRSSTNVSMGRQNADTKKSTPLGEDDRKKKKAVDHSGIVPEELSPIPIRGRTSETRTLDTTLDRLCDAEMENFPQCVVGGHVNSSKPVNPVAVLLEEGGENNFIPINDTL